MLSQAEQLQIIREAEANSPRALCRLAHWYYEGKYVPKSREKSKEYYSRLINLGPEAVNGMNKRLDYVDLLSFLGHMHFNDREIHLAKKYFVEIASYLRKNAPSCIADMRIEEERIHNRVFRINRALGIDEEIIF